MSNLVEINGNKLTTTTLIIAKGVGLEHRAVMTLLKKHSSTKTLSTFQMSKVSSGGRPTDYAVLTEEQTTFLITLMRNSEKVVSFKEALTNEFYKQRQVISAMRSQKKDPGWKKVRQDGKEVYYQKTNIIKQFVDYATAQGSSSAERYYANLANMENKALFLLEQKYKTLRDVLDIRQLATVNVADQIVEKALSDGMLASMAYKDIYKLAKSRIEDYAGIVGKSPVQRLLENDNASL